MWFESPVLISAAFFALIAAVTKIVSDNATKRRLLEARVDQDVVRALFRKGYDPELFSALKWGMVMAALGVGLVIVDVLSVHMSDPMALGVVLMWAGGGLLAYYLVATVVLRADPGGGTKVREYEGTEPREDDRGDRGVPSR
jgi:hypothetical protein